MKQVKQGFQPADLAMLVMLEDFGVATFYVIVSMLCVAAVKEIETNLVEQQISPQDV